MRWWQKIFGNRNNDLDQEIQSHIEMAVQDRIGRGESPEHARASVMRQFGNIPLIKDVDTELSSWFWIQRLMRDLRYSLRQLNNSRTFALTAILTLTLAIGANSAVFSLVHAILLRQLPFDEPSRVYSIEYADTVNLGYGSAAKDFAASFNKTAESFKTIEAAAMYSSSNVNAELGTGTALRLKATESSAAFLHVLGITPVLGRGFAASEDIPGQDHIVMISNRLWRNMFHSDPDVLGKRIKLNAFDFAIIGVLPVQVDFPANTDLWTSTIFDENTALREPGAFFTSVIVRARKGISADAVRSEFISRAAQIHAHEMNHEKPILTPIASELTKSIRGSLGILTVAVSLVLLVACMNVASLSLVRIAERRREFAICIALGAGRGRLMQQQLVESVLVALAGGALGIVIAHLCLHLLYAFHPAALENFQQPEVDPAVLVFTTATALITGLVFGIVPAWLASRENPREAAKAGVWHSAVRQSYLRKLLIIGETAAALVLLVGAGLLLRTLANMERVPLGYNTKGILSFSVSLHGEPYISKETSTLAQSAYYSALLERLAGIPGVTAVGAISNLPLDRRADMLLPVGAEATRQTTVAASPRFISNGYFEAMGIPMITGRDFSSQDTRTNPRVVIITRDLAQKLWPGENPIGHQLSCYWYCKPAPIVVGVISTTHRFGPRGPMIPEYYMPYTQQDWPYMTFVLHTQSHPEALISAVRRTAASIDPTQPIYDVKTMRQRLDDNESLVRFELFALGSFAVLAVVLVSIGLYGIISYTVTQRTHELGVRIALGAQRSALLFRIIREGFVIALAGTMLGLLSSLVLMKLLTSTLFGVTPYDPITLGTAVTLFMGIAIFASYLPAYRAASIDPAQTLRSE